MSTCGCTDTNPATPLPPNCNAIPAYAEPVAPETSCCMACVFDDLAANWVKPVGEASALLPVCDVTRFRQGQCVAVIGTNGLGGVYHIDAILTDEIEVTIHDGATYDIGGAGTVQGGRVYLLPVCPLSQAALIETIDSAIPSEFTLAVHASSDSTHGFSLAVDTGQIKLVYNQTNFEAQVATALTNLGVTSFLPELTDTELILEAAGTLNTSPYTSGGTIDYATDFSTTVPAGATHALLRVRFRLASWESTAGQDAECDGTLEFEGNAATAVHNTAQHTGATNAVGPANGHVNTVDVLRYVPIDTGTSDWTLNIEAYPTPTGVNDSADAAIQVYLVGWLIAL